ncbi:hypothetical protein BU17DRAFT_46619 [Hysterangium stoloniferum]|nr:hypothetical protein BU17DRAFT_46619 [Hysterangium stoloniferum]
MTRITNFGRKRTYLQAGFGQTDTDKQDSHVEEIVEASPNDTSLPATKKPRRKSKATATTEEEGVTHTGEDQLNSQQETEVITHKKVKTGIKRRREGEQYDRDPHPIIYWFSSAAASEKRRLKRIAEKQTHMTCLGCRKKGHIVKDCPVALTALHGDDGEGETAAAATPAKSAVGLCYRCGSSRHNLSRCKKPANPQKPLPFASCFVCSQKGHLASSCPQNQGRGIYPNGGSCKLCNQTSHLAKDCSLRATAASKSNLMLGDVRTEGGADEDDFHVIKRRRDVVEKEETVLQKLANKPEVFIAKPKPKVVVFR